MAPLPFPAQLSLRSSWSPPSASTDRCFLQLNSSRTEASLSKIRCTFSLQAPGLVQGLSCSAERRGPRQVGTLSRLAPARSREPEPLAWWRASALSASWASPACGRGREPHGSGPAGLAGLGVRLASGRFPAPSWPPRPSGSSLLLPGARGSSLPAPGSPVQGNPCPPTIPRTGGVPQSLPSQLRLRGALSSFQCEALTFESQRARMLSLGFCCRTERLCRLHPL